MKEKSAGHRTVSQMASVTFAVSRAFAAGKGKNGPSEGATESTVAMEITYARESLKVKYFLNIQCVAITLSTPFKILF